MSDDQRAELEAAIDAAKGAPENEELWDQAETLVGSLDSPDELAAAYRESMRGDLSTELAESLGQRAARFHQEWFGEDISGVVEVLNRVLEIDPQSRWAFQDITVALTNAGRWDELLALYDRNINASEDETETLRLLDEAYQVSKDLADKPENAIAYLQRLFEIKPSQKQEQALERLLEKHARWSDLISLWEDGLADLSGKERTDRKLRIATTYLDNLNDPRQALEASRSLLADDEDNDVEASKILERVVTHETTGSDVRDDALDMLRSHFLGQDRPRDFVGVLESAVALASPVVRIELHREAGNILAEQKDWAAAAGHFAALLILDFSAAAQKAMRDAAEQSGDWQTYAAGLAAAAEVCSDISRKVSLYNDAARTHIDNLNDTESAIQLFNAALAQQYIDRGDVLTVGRQLNEVLAAVERPRERLDVLERLASAETVASSRRAIIGDIARLAEELGETDRALSAWTSRREFDSKDMAALDSMISLLEREQRWEPLIQALAERSQSGKRRNQKRADLIKIAVIYQDELENVAQAIEAWQAVRNEFGDSTDVIEALSMLLGQAERWGRLLPPSARRRSDP
jgi:tetratricopeptide (TPR) repeat protein